MGNADERSQMIGGQAAAWAYMFLSALLLSVVVKHIVVNGFTNLGAVRLELAGFVLGLIVYFGVGLYYTRTM